MYSRLSQNFSSSSSHNIILISIVLSRFFLQSIVFPVSSSSSSSFYCGNNNKKHNNSNNNNNNNNRANDARLTPMREFQSAAERVTWRATYFVVISYSVHKTPTCMADPIILWNQYTWRWWGPHTVHLIERACGLVDSLVSLRLVSLWTHSCNLSCTHKAPVVVFSERTCDAFKTTNANNNSLHIGSVFTMPYNIFPS